MNILGVRAAELPAANARNLLRGGLSMVDQVVCSASSFVTIVILSRALLPAELGTYVLVFNSVMVLGALQQGFVTGPYRVLGAPNGYALDYVAAQARIQAALLVVETVLLATFLHWYLAVEGKLLIASATVLVLMQMHEFVRTVLMTRLAVSRLFAIDVLTHALRVVGLWVLYTLDVLSVVSALAWLAVSTLVAASQLDPRWFGSWRAYDIWRANWRFGRWLLAESVALQFATRSYIYAVGAMLGRDQLAAFSASQNIANAVNVMVMGLTAAAVPIAKLKLEREGYDEWKAWLMMVTFVMLFVSGAVFAAIAVCAKPLVGWLYPSFYAPFAPLVVVLAFAVWLEALSANFTSAFWTAERPELNVVGRMAAVVVALAWIYPGIREFGLYGAAAGLVMTSAMSLLVGGIFVVNGALSQSRVRTLRAAP